MSSLLQDLLTREFWKAIGGLLLACAKLAKVYTRSYARRALRRVWFVMSAIALEPLLCCKAAGMWLLMVLLTGRIKPEYFCTVAPRPCKRGN